MDTNPGSPRRKHVLIVDDDVHLAWPFKESLEERGCDATIIPDGRLALQFLLEHQLDAVVCDLQIARLEGDLLFATVERLNPDLARRFIFITSPDDHSKFVDAMASLTLRKPVAIETLMDEVLRLLQRE